VRSRRREMRTNIGSFGARLTRDQTVADGVWTKVAFNEVGWDTTGGFDPDTGGYMAGHAGKLHFATGVRFLAPDVPNRYVDLLLYKNGEPLERLTPDGPFTRPDSVPIASTETPSAEYARGFSRGEVLGNPGDVFEIYVRHDFGESTDLTLRSPDPENERTAAERHPIYFMGLWHA
jgi:hypothetical protein